MWFLYNIVEWLDSVSGYFYDAYLEVIGWVWPFYSLAIPLYWVYYAFYYLTFWFGQFNTWLEWAAGRIDAILGTWDIMSLLDTWISYAENAWAWVNDSWWNVWNIIGAWWGAVSYEVQSWIDSARDAVELLISQAELSVVELRASWDDFWTITWPEILADLGGLRSSWESFLATTLPNLVSSVMVGALIESTIRTWFPFYDELASLWGEIQGFFTDPEEYLVNKLETMLERFW